MSKLTSITPLHDPLDFQTYTPRKTGFAYPTPSNATSHVALVKRLIEEAIEQKAELETQTKKLRIEIERMKDQILRFNDDTSKTLTPFIQSMAGEIEMAIHIQSDENAKLQNQIREIKMEKAQIQELIVKATEKLAVLEETVGNYH